MRLQSQIVTYLVGPSVALATACGGPEAGDGRSEALAVEYSTTRELVVGGQGADLNSTGPIYVFPNGVLVVAQHDEGSLRFFSPAGAPLGRIGRVGNGPGEFQAIGPIGMIGDKLWIWDARQQRLTFVDQAPSVLATRRVESPAWRSGDSVGARIPTDWGFDPVHLEQSGGIDAAHVGRRFIRVDEGRWYGSVIGEMPTDASVTRVGSKEVISVPFAIAPRWERSPDGDRIGVIWVSGAPQAPGLCTLVVMSAATGDTVFRKELSLPVVPVRKHVLDSARAELAATLSPGALSNVRFPTTYPPFRSLSLDADGRVWVGLFASEKDSTRPWMIVGNTGESLGIVRLPKSQYVRFGRADRVWTISLDEDEFLQVTRYRVNFDSIGRTIGSVPPRHNER